MEVANACCEGWKAKVAETERSCSVLIANADQLKKKIIDTSKLLNLHRQLQEKFKKAEEEIKQLNEQLHAEKQETQNLQQQVTFLLASNKPTEEKLADVTAQLEAATIKLNTTSEYVKQIDATVIAGKEAVNNYERITKESARLQKELNAKEIQHKEAAKELKAQRAQIASLKKQLEHKNDTILSLEVELSMVKDKKEDTVNWESVEPSSSSIEPDYSAQDFARDLEDSIEAVTSSSHTGWLVKSRELTASPKLEKVNLARITVKELSPETSPPHKRTIAENRQRSHSDDEPSLSLQSPTEPPPQSALIAAVSKKAPFSTKLHGRKPALADYNHTSISPIIAPILATQLTPITTPLQTELLVTKPRPTPTPTASDTPKCSVMDAEMTEVSISPSPKPIKSNPVVPLPPTLPVLPITARPLPSSLATYSQAINTPVKSVSDTPASSQPTISENLTPEAIKIKLGSSAKPNPPSLRAQESIKAAPPTPDLIEVEEVEEVTSPAEVSLPEITNNSAVDVDAAHQELPTDSHTHSESEQQEAIQTLPVDAELIPTQENTLAELMSAESSTAQTGGAVKVEPIKEEVQEGPILPSLPESLHSVPASPPTPPIPELVTEQQHEYQDVEWEDGIAVETAPSTEKEHHERASEHEQKEELQQLVIIKEIVQQEAREEAKQYPREIEALFEEGEIDCGEEEVTLLSGKAVDSSSTDTPGEQEQSEEMNGAEYQPEPQPKKRAHRTRKTNTNRKRTEKSVQFELTETEHKRKRDEGEEMEEEGLAKKIHVDEEEESGPELYEQHPIISSLLLGIDKSVEIDPPLSPSLLPDDPSESPWEADKAMLPMESMQNYLCRRLFLVFERSADVSLETLSSGEDLFANFSVIVNTNMDTVVNAFLKVLHDCNSASKVDSAVFLFWHIFTNIGEKGKEFRHVFLGKVSSSILSASSFASSEHLLELIGRISKSDNDRSRCLYLAAEILRKNTNWKIRALVALAHWPDPLVAESKEQNPLLTTIENLVALAACDRANPDHHIEHEKYQELRKKCYWPFRANPESISVASLVLDLFSTLESCAAAEPETPHAMPGSFCARTDLLIKAFDLVAAHQGWQFTYDNIVTELWTMMTKSPSLHPIVLRLLGIIGRTATMNQTLELQERLKMVLAPKYIAQFTFQARVCAALSLATLCKGESKAVAVCRDWYTSLSPQQQIQIRPWRELIDICTKRY